MRKVLIINTVVFLLSQIAHKTHYIKSKCINYFAFIKTASVGTFALEGCVQCLDFLFL